MKQLLQDKAGRQSEHSESTARGWKRWLVVGMMLAAGAAAQTPVDATHGAPLDALKPPPQANRVSGESGLKQLKGHIPGWVTPSRQAGGTVDLRQTIELNVVLARDPAVQAAFTQFLADQQNRQSPYYHQWLTPQQIGELFGPTDSDVAAVSSWLTSQGLTIKQVSPGRTIIDVTGSVAKIAVAFHTNFGNFLYKGAPHLAAMTEPSIPAALAPVVQGINGLVQLPPEPLSHKSAPRQRIGAGDGTQPEIIPSGFGNSIMPGDFDIIYNLAGVHAAGNTGSTVGSTPQHVAIVARSDVAPADIYSLEAAAGLPTINWNNIYPDGTDPGTTKTGNEDEVTLDLGRVIGTAPGVIPDLVINAGLDTAIAYEINTVRDPILTISYGECESGVGKPTVLYDDMLFSSAAAEGISVFVSAGDAAAAGCDDAFDTAPSSQVLATNFYCSSGYVTCVGGTEFNDSANPSDYWSSSNGAGNVSVLSYIPEGAWNEAAGVDSKGHTVYTATGGGGGVSLYIAKPFWQAGSGVPNDGFRDTPDVAFSAAAHDGYFVCDSDGAGCPSVNSPGWVAVSGTSAAAPGMAGIAALLNTATGSRQGNLNALIYQLAANAPSAFHDVTIASSGVTGCSVGTPSLCNNSDPAPDSLTGGLAGYVVGPGYDQATGWGSLDVANFISAATQTTSATPSVPTSIVVTVAQSFQTISQGPTFTATISWPNSLLSPTGTVQFYVNGTTLGLPVAVSNGVAVLNYEGFGIPGNYAITAIYSGDSVFETSTSTAVAYSVVSFITPVFTTSAPQVITQILIPASLPNQTDYDQFTLPTITGPAARFFSVVSNLNTCSGQKSGFTCSVSVVFSPVTVLPSGQTFDATLNVSYLACEPGPTNCSQVTSSSPMVGVATGSLPSYGAQIQITPTQPVLVQPGNYGSELFQDMKGNVYASLSNTLVEFTPTQAYTPYSTPTLLAGTGGAGGSGDKGVAVIAGIDPYGIAVSAYTGYVYAVDSGQGVVRDIQGGDIYLDMGAYGLSCRQIDQTYHIGFTTGAGCFGVDELAKPTSLATDGINLFVTDVGSDTISEQDATGTITILAGYADLAFPYEGYETNFIYPGYSGNKGLASHAQLNQPGGMAVDPSANLYVADTINNVVRQIDYSNTITTWIGQGPGDSGSFSVGLGDGDAAQALLSYPLALTFDSQGNMYVIDQNGYALRKVTVRHGYFGNPPLEITTLYSLPHSTFPPPVSFASGTPVIDSTGELLYSNFFYNPYGTYAFPTPAPGLYEVLGNGALTFATEDVGISAGTQNVTISNPGGAGLNITGLTMGGANPGDFTADDSACTSPILPAATCSIYVTYTPTAQYTASTRTATIYLSTNVGSGTQQITLTGGANPALTLAVAGRIYQPSYNWSNASLPVAYVKAAGGVPPYNFTYSIDSSTGSWYLNYGTNPADIAGVPLQTGAIPYTITVNDSAGGQTTYSSQFIATGEGTYINVSDPQTMSASGTSVFVSATLNQGDYLNPGAVSPSGGLQFSIDGGSNNGYPTSNGVLAPTEFDFDILYHTITINYLGDNNYSGLTNPTVLTVNGNRPQTIVFPGNGLSTTAGTTIALTAQATSGLPVTYTVQSGPGYIDATRTNLVLYAPGTVNVVASQAGNASFAAAPSVIDTFNSN
jgi:hypothetical protein